MKKISQLASKLDRLLKFFEYQGEENLTFIKLENLKISLYL